VYEGRGVFWNLKSLSRSHTHSRSLIYYVSILHSSELFIKRPPPLWIYRPRKSVISEARVFKALGCSSGYSVCCVFCTLCACSWTWSASLSLSLSLSLCLHGSFFKLISLCLMANLLLECILCVSCSCSMRHYHALIKP